MLFFAGSAPLIFFGRRSIYNVLIDRLWLRNGVTNLNFLPFVFDDIFVLFAHSVKNITKLLYKIINTSNNSTSNHSADKLVEFQIVLNVYYFIFSQHQ